ncbi:MAG: ABC transporter substrate-binding protein [bacterium]|jgi:alpha-1,4-digalacturonate transport system substrate-binding protein
MKIFAKKMIGALLSTGLALSVGFSAHAVELSVMLNADGKETAVLGDLIERYQKQNPGVTIKMNVVGYNVIREQLESQLQAGGGPDIGKITNLGGLNPYYIDLTPYVNASDWESMYGAVLPWYRAGKPGGIYGFHSEMTVTGPYINATMFEEAGVAIPQAGATWDEWADATRAVMQKTGSYAAMVMDRSGHRMAGPAMSYGAKYFDAQGKLIVDDGFRSFAERMVSWHREGLMPADIWPAVSGSKYANGNEMFFNQDVPFYMSGSWNVANVSKNVGDKFDWRVVPVPCGPSGCGIMPGGAGYVAFNTSKNPAEAAKFVAWLGNYEQAKEYYSRIYAIPANARVQSEGIDYSQYGATPSISEGLNVFAAGAAKAAQQTPQAYQLQGNPFNFVIFNATTQYLAGVMNEELTMSEAIDKIRQEIADKTK